MVIIALELVANLIINTKKYHNIQYKIIRTPKEKDDLYLRRTAMNEREAYVYTMTIYDQFNLVLQ